MFEFLRKSSILEAGILNEFTDYHSHILPGVDDGVKSVDEAIDLLDSYEALGVKRIVFTPHIFEKFPQNNAVFLRSRFKEFQTLYKGNIEISLGAEYMLDYKFEEHLNSGDLLPIVDNYLLVETSYMSPPFNFVDLLRAIQSKGYFVVLAHPERYAYMGIDYCKQLKDMGILFQLNLLSMVGVYGKRVEQKAKTLLNSGSYNLIGTDIHNLGYHLSQFHRPKLSRKEINNILQLKSSVFI